MPFHGRHIANHCGAWPIIVGAHVGAPLRHDPETDTRELLPMTEQTLFTPTTDPRWLITIEGFEPTIEAAVEAVLAQVNGYSGVRAALEEGHPNARPATFLAGVFNTPTTPQAPELEEPVPELVVCPNPYRLEMRVEGAELNLATAELVEMRRILDLRQGVTVREWRMRDGEGRITRLRSLRAASLADRHIQLYALEVTPENYSAALGIALGIAGDVTNEYAAQHLAVTNASSNAAGEELSARTLQSGYALHYHGHSVFHSPDATVTVLPSADATYAGCAWTFAANQGQTYRLERVVRITTSRDGIDGAPSPTQNSPAVFRVAPPQRTEEGGSISEKSFSTHLVDHISAWAARWASCDIEIAGDDALQRQVRFALYHLVGAAHAGDERASVGARALTGERYRGHVFWDNEIFVWPFFLYTEPATARALLMYRYHTLAGARAKAAAMGYQGAMYPWEAADTGEEVTPAFMISGGERVPVLTGIEEHHISADIAYAVWQYIQATGDMAFLYGPGAQMLIEIARFWASRATLGDDGLYHIERVIGPDEYHETVDDNAYTNLLARWVLRTAGAVVDQLRTDRPERLAELAAQQVWFPPEEERWQRIAEGLTTGFDAASGLIEQFKGYHQLEEIDLSEHDTNVATVDAKLGWYAMQRTKVLKQADVVMALILLWDEFAPAVRAANFHYYEPRTSHDSSLSPSFHALFAARLGELELAEGYLRKAALIDLDLSRKGHAGATGGIHIAAQGGIWQALVFGFMGVYPEARGLRIEPHVPLHWGRLSLPVQWQGRTLRLSADSSGDTDVALVAGAPLEVCVAGEWRVVSR
jgi:trehalose/maltose hydrolase-like predicted phosphorylase